MTRAQAHADMDLYCEPTGTAEPSFLLQCHGGSVYTRHVYFIKENINTCIHKGKYLCPPVEPLWRII